MKKHVIIVLLSLFAISCSSTKMAVDWADTFLAWKMDDAFDLSREQKKQLRPQLDAALTTIKKEMFPGYSDFLLDAKKELTAANDKRNTELALGKIEQKMDEQLNLTLQKVKPQLVSMSQQIRIGNWKEFKNEFQQRNEDLLDDGPSKKMKKRIEQWVGTLNKDQKNKIEDFEKNQAFPIAVRIKNRNQTLQKFEAIAQVSDHSLNTEQFGKALSMVTEDYRAFQSPEYNSAMQIYRGKLRELIADLYLSLSDDQRHELFANIEKRARDLRQLAN